MNDLQSSLFNTRNMLSERYIHGQGIEIGALHMPLFVPENVDVKYIDYVSKDVLEKQYPELSEKELVEVDIVDNGEQLRSIEDGSCDFIIANHFIEHCENPIGTIRNHLSKLKVDGILYYAIPNKKYTFDIEREVTTFNHLVLDDNGCIELHRDCHYKDYFENVLKIENINEDFEILKEKFDHIHYHVWDTNSFINFINHLNEYLGYTFEVENFTKNGVEMIVVLRKTSVLNHASYEDIVAKIKKISEKRDVYIWGTGKAAESSNSVLEKKGIKIKGFVDGFKKEGEFLELQIIHKEELRRLSNFSGNLNKPFIIIGSTFWEEIIKDLKSMGYIEFEDFIRKV